MGDPKRTVLVVEDDPHIRELICEALRADRLSIVEAADGAAAVKAARDRRPDLIVLDLGLPVLDGVAVAEQVHEMYDVPIPFIVVTAGGRAGDVSRIRAVAAFTKPFDIDAFVAAVKQAITPLPATADTMKARPVET